MGDLTVEIDGVSGAALPGATLFEVASQQEVRVPTSCRGQGKCRECLVEIESGEELLEPRTPEEESLAPELRLSCRAALRSTSGELRCTTLKRGSLRIETESRGLDNERPLDPAVTRKNGQVLIDDEPVAESSGPLLGLAIDLGTTTVALRLFDLENGAALAGYSFENPQRFAGSDVMARIQYDTDHPGRLMQRVLLGYLGHAIEALPCEPEDLYEVVVAANTTMRDLLFGLDLHPIGQSPYRSTTETEWREGARETTALSTPSRKTGLPIHPGGRVVALPLIASHVGADTAACLLATGMADADGVSVLMDVGTNTEMVIGRKDRLFAASCPAGPAFEGRGVECGMPALDGAIERVRIGPAGELGFEIIGGCAPTGLCGSGMVDLLSELLRTGQMNQQGRFVEDLARDDQSFVLTATSDGKPCLQLTENDISELAQAKGANVAGFLGLLAHSSFAAGEIERFYLAGGFAAHLDLDAARAIGFVPDLPRTRFVKVGNAALEGASRALLSLSSRRRLERQVKQIEHVQLETRPDFFEHFVDGCQFVPVGTPEAPEGGSR